MKARFLRVRQTGPAILPRAKWAILTILSGAKRVVLPAILSGAKRVVLPAILAVLWLGASARAEDLPSVPRKDLWVTNGPVSAIVRSDDTIYIGGYFTQVGPRTGCGVPIDTASGSPVAVYPEVNGDVYACAADESGGWYIGGDFTYVGGVARNRIAHILSDGSVDPAWNPDANYTVLALAVSGSTVYAGGHFTLIGGQTRDRIAALDAATGLATAWNPGANNWVEALAVSGSMVYVGGGFTSIGGQARNRIAALDATMGLATAWNADANDAVRALAVSDSTVYAGGGFSLIGGQARNGIAALDATMGLATAWNPGANEQVSALAVSGSTVYAGGWFTSIGGQGRNYIAALDAATGLATAWNPDANNGVGALAVSGTTVYAGGEFTSIGGQARNYIAALDEATGIATAWNPDVNSGVNDLAVSGTMVYAGGRFTSIGGQTRNNIAALDATTGAATAWNPDAENGVLALAVSGSMVYAGGQFTSIGGQTRNRIAALDEATGLATSWNPDANNQVEALAVSGTMVYAGGAFTSIGGQARDRIAALDAATGLATTWNPNANHWVQTLAVSGSTVYAGGYFTSIGGQARNRIAALDATTGLATVWNPNANSYVYALAVSGTMVYAGGFFNSIGGQVRNRIAALDATSGAATAWNPNANIYVYALAVSGSTVYAGGWFTSVGGQARNYIAALDAASGAATAWNPNANTYVHALALSGSTVYAGGEFISIGPLAQSGIAQFSPPPPRIESVVYNDLDDDGAVETSETLTLVMNRAVTINAAQVTQSDFYLCVSGDTLGGAGFSAAPSPDNARHVVLTLGANPVLNLAGTANPSVTAPGSPSGLDFSTSLAVSDVRSAKDGMPAEAGGQPGVDDSAVDILFACVPKTTSITASVGGTATVANSPDAAYTSHSLAIPAGALSQNVSVTMRPPQVNLGVLDAVQIDVVAAGGGGVGGAIKTKAAGESRAGVSPAEPVRSAAFRPLQEDRVDLNGLKPALQTIEKQGTGTSGYRLAGASPRFSTGAGGDNLAGASPRFSLRTSSDPPFSQPVTLTLEYKDSDYDTEAGDVEASMRIHQLVLNPPSEYEWKPVPAVRQNQLGDNTVSVLLDSLNPCGDTGAIRVFAVLPGWTIEPIKAHIRPKVGGTAVIPMPPLPPGKKKGGLGRLVEITAGAGGDYTLHHLEIPNYETTTSTDTARVTLTLTQPTLLQRAGGGGRCFPSDSSALFVVTTRDADDNPVAFTSPTNIRVQFMDGSLNAYNDLRTFDDTGHSRSYLRIVWDALDGPCVDFQFVDRPVTITPAAGGGTVEAQSVPNLTGASGEGVWGVVLDPPEPASVPPGVWRRYGGGPSRWVLRGR